MHPFISRRLVASLLAVLVVAGCREKTELSTPASISKATSDLEQAFESSSQPTKKNVEVAARAMEKSDYEKAYVSLQLIQAEPEITYAQALAARRSMHILQERLARAVVAGDPAAIRAAEAIKRLQP